MLPRLSSSWLIVLLACCRPSDGAGQADASAYDNLCASQVELNANVYHHAEAKQTEVTRLFDAVSQYYSRQGIPLTIKVSAWRAASGFEQNERASDDADMAIYVGPAEWGRGYLGPPYYSAMADVLGGGALGGGAIDLGNRSVRWVAFLINNYLGQQTYYGLDPPAVFADHACLRQDLMRNPYDLEGDLVLCDATRRIICFNLRQLATHKKEGIFVPEPQPVHGERVQRRVSETVLFRVVVSRSSKDPCAIYRSFYSVDHGAIEYATSPLDVERPGPDNAIYFALNFTGWYGGAKIVCGSESYFVPSPVFDECFFRNQARTVSACALRCTQPGTWCEVI